MSFISCIVSRFLFTGCKDIYLFRDLEKYFFGQKVQNMAVFPTKCTFLHFFNKFLYNILAYVNNLLYLCSRNLEISSFALFDIQTLKNVWPGSSRSRDLGRACRGLVGVPAMGLQGLFIRQNSPPPFSLFPSLSGCIFIVTFLGFFAF